MISPGGKGFKNEFSLALLCRKIAPLFSHRFCSIINFSKFICLKFAISNMLVTIATKVNREVKSERYAHCINKYLIKLLRKKSCVFGIIYKSRMVAMEKQIAKS